MNHDFCPHDTLSKNVSRYNAEVIINESWFLPLRFIIYAVLWYNARVLIQGDTLLIVLFNCIHLVKMYINSCTTKIFQDIVIISWYILVAVTLVPILFSLLSIKRAAGTMMYVLIVLTYNLLILLQLIVLVMINWCMYMYHSTDCMSYTIEYIYTVLSYKGWSVWFIMMALVIS
jgi:hypothetical protein